MDKQQLFKLIGIIKNKSQVDKIPIVRSQTIELIIKLINQQQYQYILEIGTGYGYSASSMLICKSIKKIITIENNKFNFEIAQYFLKKTLKVTCLNLNAFDYEPQQKFDLIFIDGPKSHQEILVNKCIKYLNNDGCIIVDNIFLNKIRQKNILTKNQRTLLNKVDKFHK
jgi:predicted O-methyltransferase YrrM